MDCSVSYATTSEDTASMDRRAPLLILGTKANETSPHAEPAAQAQLSAPRKFGRRSAPAIVWDLRIVARCAYHEFHSHNAEE